MACPGRRFIRLLKNFFLTHFGNWHIDITSCLGPIG